MYSNETHLFSLLLVVYFRATGLLLLTFAVLVLVRKSSAALRHAVLLTSLICVSALPLQTTLNPVLTLKLPYFARNSQVQAVNAVQSFSPVKQAKQEPLFSVSLPVSRKRADERLPTVRIASTNLVAPKQQTAMVASLDWRSIVLAVWFIGALLLLTRLTISHMKAWRLTVLARPYVGVETAVQTKLKSRGCKIVESQSVTMPMTWGLTPPTVLLPAEAVSWSDSTVDVVLLHEAAHIRRFDWLTQLISEAALAVYWPNPLFWFLAARMRIEAEIACDDSVLLTGVNAISYAEELLRCVQGGRFPLRSLATVGMADKSFLSKRIKSVLDLSCSRIALGRGAAASILVTASVVTLIVGVTRIGRSEPSIGFEASMTSQSDRNAESVSLKEGNPASSTSSTGDGDKWTRSLSNGVVIKLLGITSDPEGGNAQGWWKPDGQPVADPNYSLPSIDPSGGGFGDQYQRRTVYFHVMSAGGIADLSMEGEITRPSVYESGNFYSGKSIITTDHRLPPATEEWGKLGMAFDSPTDKFNYRFGVASGPWQTVSDIPNAFHPKLMTQVIYGVKEQYAAYINMDDHPSLDFQVVSGKWTHVSLLPQGQSKTDDAAYRFIALDAYGKPVQIKNWLAQGNNDFKDAAVSPETFTNIARFVIQSRTYIWATFESIHNEPTLPPGVISPADDVPMPAPSAGYTKTLPDGSRISLIAAMRGKADGERWWLPNGKSLKGRIASLQTLSLIPGSVDGDQVRQVFVEYSSRHWNDVYCVMKLTSDVNRTPTVKAEFEPNDSGINSLPVEIPLNACFPAGTSAKKIFVQLGVTSSKWSKLAFQPMTLTPAMIAPHVSGMNEFFDVSLSMGNLPAIIYSDRNGVAKSIYFLPRDHKLPDGYALRIVAVLRDGSRRTLINNSSRVINSEIIPVSTLSFNPQISAATGIQDLSSVVRFDLEAQPYTWTTFPPIPVDPTSQ